MSPKPTPTNDMTEEQGSGFDFREMLDAVILHWHWFALSIIACLFLALIYLRYTPPVYSTWAEVLIKEDDPYSRNIKGNALVDFSQLGFMTNSNGFDNEMEILASKQLALRAVTNLKLHITYAYKGTLSDQEIYRTSPVVADMPTEYLDTLSAPVILEITPKEEGGFHLDGEALGEEFESEIDSFPAVVNTASGLVTLLPSADSTCVFDTRTLRISIVRPFVMATAYQQGTTIEPISKLTTIARISMNGTNRKRMEDYMNELIRAYNDDANEMKNEVALKTEAFINNRIKIIDAELGTTESDLENFKKRNNLVDLSSDAASAYKGMENYQERQIELQTQMVLVNSLMEYVENPLNHLEIIPANLGLTDQGLNRIISEYNAKVVERNRLLKTAPETSPVVVAATNAIESLYPGIRHSLSSVYSNLRVQKRNIDDQVNEFVNRLSSAPTQERVLADIGRQQAVKAALYQILLQKREENAISLASTVDKAQVVDLPESSLSPIAPKKNLVLLIALVLGAGIPAGIIYLLNLLRYRIEGRNDIEKLTNLPILADIFTADIPKGSPNSIVVHENQNDMMAETFRSLRTNLGFIMSKTDKVLLCTSIVPGEGKTFVTGNFGVSQALMGRKVLVVELDLRKPRLARTYGLTSGQSGLTAYLSGQDESDEFLRKQIFKSGIHQNLDIMPAGMIPPNPSELIMSKLMDRAFARFREWYDMVIIDTPPVGLVSDTLQLGRLADATLIVCRCDYSPKRNFEIVNKVHEENKLPKMSLVLNGVDLKSRKYSYYYGYGSYGRYGRYGSYGRYGNYSNYGDYIDGKKPKSKFKSLFGKKSKHTKA